MLAGGPQASGAVGPNRTTDATCDERQDDGAAAPLGEHRRLGQVGGGVVAALDPDVGAQRAEDLGRRVLVEDGDDVDAVQCVEDRCAVVLGDDRSGRALQPADGAAGVQADHQASHSRRATGVGAGVAERRPDADSLFGRLAAEVR
jgi:hypothetical protein